MERLVRVITFNEQRELLINEDQVVSIEKFGNADISKLRLSNGDELIIQSPSYSSWYNDLIARYD